MNAQIPNCQASTFAKRKRFIQYLMNQPHTNYYMDSSYINYVMSDMSKLYVKMYNMLTNQRVYNKIIRCFYCRIHLLSKKGVNKN